jgi:hypothetical protein
MLSVARMSRFGLRTAVLTIGIVWRMGWSMTVRIRVMGQSK